MEDHNKCKIARSDCFKFMDDIPDHSIDLILTDPPYNISGLATNIRFQTRNDMTGIKSDDWDVNFSPPDLLEPFRRILSPKGNIYIFSSSRLIGDYWRSFDPFFNLNLLCWHKTNPAPSVRKSSYLNSLEHIIAAWYPNSQHVFNFTTQNDMHNFFQGPACGGNERLSDSSGKSLHPTQKPLWLLEKIINQASLPGNLVFDPFAGTFSTGVAALKNGRRFIGCEINQHYYDMGYERIKAQAQQDRLF